jgi:hypothetical protein
MRLVEEVLTDIKTYTEVANKDLGAISMAMQAGWQCAVREAKDKLVELRKEYDSAVSSRTVGLFVSGPEDKLEELGKLVKNENGLTVNVSLMYEKIADRIWPSIGRTMMFGMQQFTILMDTLRQISIDLDVQDVKPMGYKEVCIQTKDDLVSHVRTLVREAVGDKLNAKLIKQTILNHCLNQQTAAKYILVLLKNSIDEEIYELSQSLNTYTKAKLTKDEELTRDSVTKMFKRARAK